MYHCIMWACIQSCLTFVTPWTVAHQAPLSMAFPRHEHWTGLPFPPPGECIYINLKCQWTECSNKKTKSGRLDRKKKAPRAFNMLPTGDPLTAKYTHGLKVKSEGMEKKKWGNGKRYFMQTEMTRKQELQSP